MNYIPDYSSSFGNIKANRSSFSRSEDINKIK